MRRRAILFMSFVGLVIMLLLVAYCPKPKPGKPVPVDEHDPIGGIHDDRR